MTITRDEDVPAEVGHLMAAFNRCADGHDADTVLNASIQMLIAGIVFNAKSRCASADQLLRFCDHVGSLVTAGVRENWDRRAQDSDIAVDLS